MTNQQFKCSLQNKPLKHNNFHDPGMALVILSQQDQSIHNVNQIAFKPAFVKEIKCRFKNTHNVLLNHAQKKSTLYAKSAQKPKGYVTLQLGAASKESNTTSLNLLSELHLNIAQLIMNNSNSKLNLETCKPQQQHNIGHNARHSTCFAQSLVQRYVSKHNQRRTNSCQRFTVIRSPFVFKKSREQFGLTRKSCFVKLALTKAQQHTYAQHLIATKLPSELQLTFVN